ncbi:MAG: hypothetical protein ACI396_01915 [Acutalibacteraceae bacterium]
MINPKCPYCGASTATVGGPDGNPFNVNRKTKIICQNCKRIISEYSDNTLDYVQAKPVLKITATAVGGGVTITAEKTIPFEDGTYSLGDEYPFTRLAADENPPYSFGSIMIRGDEVTVAGETVKVGEQPVEIVKHLTAYAPDKHPVKETITLTVLQDIEL